MNKNLIQDKKIFYGGLVYFLMMCAFIAIRILSQYKVFDIINDDITDYLVTIVIQIGIMVLFPLVIYKLLAKESFKQIFKSFGFKKVSFKTILASFAIGILAYIIIIFVSSIWSSIMHLLGYPQGVTTTSTSTIPAWASCLLAIVFTGMFPGFCEEFAHRGFALNNIKKDGVWRAILFTALLFALMHLSYSKVCYAFVIGIVLGIVAMLSKSIWPAIIVHFTNNTISTYLTYATNNDWVGGNFVNSILNYFNNANYISTFIVSFLILCIVTFLMALLIVKIYMEGKKQHYFDFKKNLYNSMPTDELKQSFKQMTDKEIFNLYKETLDLDTKNKIEKLNITPSEYAIRKVNQRPIQYLLDEDVIKTNTVNTFDYLFYYCTIFLGTIVTFMTFLWGVI